MQCLCRNLADFGPIILSGSLPHTSSLSGHVMGWAGRQERRRRQKMVGGTKNYFYIYIWGHGGAHKCVNLKDRRIDQKPITGRVSRAFCPTQVFQLFPYAATSHQSLNSVQANINFANFILSLILSLVSEVWKSFPSLQNDSLQLLSNQLLTLLVSRESLFL